MFIIDWCNCITYYQVTAVGYLSDLFYILQLYSEG